MEVDRWFPPGIAGCESIQPLLDRQQIANRIPAQSHVLMLARGFGRMHNAPFTMGNAEASARGKTEPAATLCAVSIVHSGRRPARATIARFYSAQSWRHYQRPV